MRFGNSRLRTSLLSQKMHAPGSSIIVVVVTKLINAYTKVIRWFKSKSGIRSRLQKL